MQNDASQRFKMMTETRVSRLITRLAVPTIISMLVTALYNMTDTYFVAQLGTSATGAVGIVFSLMALIQAIGFTLGMGAGNNISRLLGQKNREQADVAGAAGFFGSLAVGLVIAIAGLLNVDGLVRLLGATDTIAPYAASYARYILIGTPYMAAAFVLNNILRSQGCAAYAMVGITVGALLNVALDPLFIFVLDMGISGAALATILSQLVSFLILLWMSYRHGEVRLRFKNLPRTWEMYGRILYTGMPSFWRQGMATLASIVLNVCAGTYTGALADAAIAAMSVVSRAVWLASSALVGFGQGFQPVCGFNYGAKRYDRVCDAFWFCVKVGTIGLAIMGVGLFVLAEPIVMLFRADDPDVIRIGTVALRMQCVTLPLQAMTVLANMIYQSIGDGNRASLLSVTRQGLFFVPAILILSPLLGILGVQLAQPVAELASFLLAVPMALSLMRRLRQQNNLPQV